MVLSPSRGGSVRSCPRCRAGRAARSPLRLSCWHRRRARRLPGRSSSVLSHCRARGLASCLAPDQGCSACVSHKWKLRDSLRQNKPAVLRPSSIRGPKCETLCPGVFDGNFTVLCTICLILNSENKRRTCFGCCWDFECFPRASNEKGEANSWIVRPSNL